MFNIPGLLRLIRVCLFIIFLLFYSHSEQISINKKLSRSIPFATASGLKKCLKKSLNAIEDPEEMVFQKNFDYTPNLLKDVNN